MEVRNLSGMGVSTGFGNMQTRLNGPIMRLRPQGAKDELLPVVRFYVPPQDVEPDEMERLIEETERQYEEAMRVHRSVARAVWLPWPFRSLALRRSYRRLVKILDELRVPPCGRRPDFCHSYLALIADAVVELVRAEAKLLAARGIYFDPARNSRWPFIVDVLGSGSTSVTMGTLLAERLAHLRAEIQSITPVLFLSLPHPAEIEDREPRMRAVLRRVFRQALQLIHQGVPVFVTVNGYYATQNEDILWPHEEHEKIHDEVHPAAAWCLNAPEPSQERPRFSEYDEVMAEAVKFAVKFFAAEGENVGRELLLETQQGRIFVLGGPLQLSLEGLFTSATLFPISLIKLDNVNTECGVWGIVGSRQTVNAIGGVSEVTYVKTVRRERLQAWGIIKTTPSNVISAYMTYLKKWGISENWGVAVKS